jgi:HTH-type transcriptional regulator/antitoxin MqsA
MEKEQAPRCPETGQLMKKETRPITLRYQGKESTFDMPGWYCDHCEAAVHTGEDMLVSDNALSDLKENN